MKKRKTTGFFLVSIAVVAMVFLGCKEKKPEPKYECRTKEGTLWVGRHVDTKEECIEQGGEWKRKGLVGGGDPAK
jgi:hypothetical protein